MRRRLILFTITFSAFYLLLHLAYDIPNIIHGSSRFMGGVDTAGGLFTRGVDFVFAYLFAVVPYLTFRHYYPGKRFAPIFFVLMTLLPVVFFFSYGIESELLRKISTGTSRPALRLRFYFLDHLFYIVLYVIYGIAFYFIRYAYFREMQQKELLLQNRESELSFLRSQINPHFLFNSLNNIYSLVYLQSPHSLEAIAGFSELLRYMLYDTTQDVPLEKEVFYIRQFISLHELKNEQVSSTRFDVTGPVQNVFIPPLLLIPFVENAFKHGSAAEEQIVLSLETDAKRTTFYCQNKKNTGRKDPTGGIGLQNVRRRLQLLYPGKHNLSVMDGPELFIVKLELDHD